MSKPQTEHDFTALHQTLDRYVEQRLAPGFASAIMVDGKVVDQFTTGWADIEAQVPLRLDHIFRIYSNTKLVTSMAALLLWQDGVLDLDEPVERCLPQLARRQVLRRGATSLSDTEPAHKPITARHLLTHTAGFSYGFFNPAAVLDQAYIAAKIHDPNRSLAQMLELLEPLPLAFEPGTSFEYSIATDIMARLVEVLSRHSFGDFIRTRIFEPLGMADTGFVIPPQDQHRLAAFYVGAHALELMKPGLNRVPHSPYRQAYLQPFARQSGGGGLVSTLANMLALLRACQADTPGPQLLKPATQQLMLKNQLPQGLWQRFTLAPTVPGKGHGLAGGITLWPGPTDHPEAGGELYWGGVAGTQWFINPRHRLAAALMTQRQMSFMHPFSFDWKRGVYDAVVPRGATQSAKP